MTIFDILREADEDQQAANNNEEGTTSTDNSVDVGTDDTTGNDEEDINEDDFDIDTSLDDEGAADDTTDGEDGGDDSSVSSDSSSDGGLDDEDEEVNDVNTDIFSSLTAEEQQIKIKELKRQYRELYISCDKILERLNSIDMDDETLTLFDRFSNTLYDLKVYISEYISSIFATKSFVENDIMFNRFLMIIDCMNEIIEKFVKKKEKEK